MISWKRDRAKLDQNIAMTDRSLNGREIIQRMLLIFLRVQCFEGLINAYPIENINISMVMKRSDSC